MAPGRRCREAQCSRCARSIRSDLESGSGSGDRATSRDPRESGLGGHSGGALHLPDRAIAVLLSEKAFADAVGLRRDFEELVVGEELDRVVERELADAVELRGDVGVAAPHVREVLLAYDVYLEVALADVLADDHALVHLDAGVEEELPPILRGVEPERRGRPVLECDERAELARGDRAGERAVAFDERVHHAAPARGGVERLPEPEQSARRDLVDGVHHAVVAVLHVLERSAAAAGELDHGAELFLRDLDLELLVRLLRLAVDFLQDHLRPRDLELVTLAPHRLDEDREVQLAAAAHHERVGRVAVGDAERDIALELGVETLAKLAARDELSFAARERAVVDAERHAKGRLLDTDRWKWPRVGRVRDGVADPRLDARDGDDVPGGGFVDLLAREAVEGEELRDLGRREVPLVVDPRD